MPEPINTAAGVSLLALAVSLTSPELGAYAVITIGGIGGGLWALSSAATTTRTAGAWLMLRCVVTAIILTAVIAQSIGSYFNVTVDGAYVLVSFAIGALGNRWQDIIDTIKNRIMGVISNAGKPQ